MIESSIFEGIFGTNILPIFGVLLCKYCNILQYIDSIFLNSVNILINNSRLLIRSPALKTRVRSRRASAAAQRQRQPDDPDDPDENESMLSAGARISEIYACYGIRCARLRGIRLHVCELRLGPAQQ